MSVLAAPVRATDDGSGRQVVEVTVRGGYHPSTVVARAGVPLRIVFNRDEAEECSERVYFSAPRIERHLAANSATVVDLPAGPPREVRFTCGMGRYRGHVDFIDQRPTSFVWRMRAEGARAETPLAIALILWICSLPLVALLAVLAFDPGAALLAAAAALVAWIAGCLWASRRSPSSES